MRKPADMEATKRSILRYMRRYDREWRNDESRVWCAPWEFEGCTPPEEDAGMGVVLIRGRVRRAFTDLTAEGLLERSAIRGARVFYALTDRARDEVPYEPSGGATVGLHSEEAA